MWNIDTIFNQITTASAQRFYTYKLIVFLVLASLFFATPSYNYFSALVSCTEGPIPCQSWTAVQQKAANLRDNLTAFYPESHAAKKVFRLTVPFLMKITGLSPYGIYTVQFFLGLVLLYLLYQFAYTHFNRDPVIATLFITATSFVYFGRSFYVDLYSWFDGWAFILLCLTLTLNHAFLIFCAALLAAWTDERAFIALSIAIIAHQTVMVDGNDFKFKTIIKPHKKSIAIFAAMIFYLATRWYLQQQGMKTPDTNLGMFVLMLQIDFAGFGIWTFFEGFWLPICCFFGLAWYNKHYFLLLLYLMPVIVLSTVSLMVFDITRSGSYLFYMILPALLYLHKYLNQHQFRNLLLFSAIVCFLFPAYYVIADTKPFFHWYKPCFIKGLEYFLQTRL